MGLLNRLGVLTQRFIAMRTKSQWIWLLGTSAFLVILLFLSTLLTPYQPPKVAISDKSTAVYQRARVVDAPQGNTVRVVLLDGHSSGDFEVVRIGDRTAERAITPGEVILIGQIADGSDAMFYLDRFRIPGLVLLLALFVVLVLVIGGRRGAASMIGLLVSILVVGWGIIPLIIRGLDASVVSLGGAYVIAVVSVLISHGVHRRTFISIVCIMIILTLVALLSYIAVIGVSLTGISDEASYYLSIGGHHIDMRGMVVGGIIIASLGVLDDVITTQVAAVEKIYEANYQQSRKMLYRAAFSIGGEHIASLVNTLALAYVGASLPFIVTLVMQSQVSLLTLLNSEYIATEVVRTFVASIGLILAVPVSTLAAVFIYTRTRAAHPPYGTLEL